MAKAAATTTRSLLSLFVILSLLAVLGADDDGVGSGGGGSRRCPPIPSMTAERACNAVAGTRRMLELCLSTLRAGAGAGAGAGAAVPVTLHAAAAVRGALDAYAATVAAATTLLDGGEVPADDERAAFGDCMVGYGRARVAMARVAGDLLAAAGGCDGSAGGGIKAGYTEGLRGMDACRRGLLNYPASPLYARNLADRNVTLLAALLCSLVPAPPA